MTLPIYFEPKKSLNLVNLTDEFNFLKSLHLKDKLPNALLLSGDKGNGKSTLINHLLYFIFDKKNYDEKTNKLNIVSKFHNQFINNTFPNIIYISGADYENTKIENIRNLKKNIFQTSILEKPKFIILDDVELLNANCLNALLKLIEEPNKNNHFILINNNSKSLIDTVVSRCLQIKIILSESNRSSIIQSLLKMFELKSFLDPKKTFLSPGYYIKFNHIFEENEIFINSDFLKNISILLNLYKKNKDVLYIDMILFLTDFHYKKIQGDNSIKTEKIIEQKRFIFENINKFFLYNLNQNAFLNNVNNKINVE